MGLDINGINCWISEKDKGKNRQRLIFQNLCKIESDQNFIAPLQRLKGFVTRFRLQNKSKLKLGIPSGVSVLDLTSFKSYFNLSKKKKK